MLALHDHFDIPRVTGKQLIGLKSVFHFVNAVMTTRFADPVYTTVWETCMFYFYCRAHTDFWAALHFICIPGSVSLGESHRFPIEEQYKCVLSFFPVTFIT